ncbi:hypothetical protein NGA_0368200, partial [Nannochloropsis gaditana CCMP526]|uniref:uncharacterized protein n=1 Tax=Nannochloropsis gaditana (strain CCMP526) TaxID=1093141 RepID=UPI00029F7640
MPRKKREFHSSTILLRLLFVQSLVLFLESASCVTLSSPTPEGIMSSRLPKRPCIFYFGSSRVASQHHKHRHLGLIPPPSFCFCTSSLPVVASLPLPRHKRTAFPSLWPMPRRRVIPKFRHFSSSSASSSSFSSSSSSSQPLSPSTPSSTPSTHPAATPSTYTCSAISPEEMERIGEGLWEAGLAVGHTVFLY